MLAEPSKHDGPPRRSAPAVWRGALWGAVVAGLLWGEPFVATQALGQAAGGSKPLASCPVQTFSSGRRTAMDRFNNGGLILSTPTDDPMLDYHPLVEDPGPQPPANEQHPRPTGDPSMLRVLVTGPGAARVIEFRVLIDGAPFRDRREQWIDALIEQAPAEEQLKRAGEAFSSALATLGEAADLSILAPPDKSAPQRRTSPTLRSRLRHFLAVMEGDIDRQEITTLLNQWPAGPAVTVLSPARSWQRASDAPLLMLLDRSADGVLSADEIAGAAAALSAADTNEDGVVKTDELRHATDRRRGRRATGGHLVTVIDSAGDWKQKLGRAAEQLDTERIATGPPDLRCEVRFGSSPTRNATGTVELASPVDAPTHSGAMAIGVDFGAEVYELSAIEPPGGAQPSVMGMQDAPEQVAIGAALDGRPLLRLLDTDGDDRLTAREQRALPRLLAQLDRNQDGQLNAGEVPEAVRIAVGRGAHVHRLLDEPAVAATALVEPGPAVAAPDWFRPMDANRDGELSRDEFPGDAEQFKTLDTNGDGLISTQEAAAAEG